MTLDLRSRELGDRLRLARVASGKSGLDAATALALSPPQVTRIEHGTRTASALHVALMLGLYGVPPTELKEILELATSGADERGAPPSYWVRPHPGLPHEIVPSVVFACRTASTVTWYQPHALPLMLTPDFPHTNADTATETETDRIKWREARQVYATMLSRSGTQNVQFYLHETALRAANQESLTHLTAWMWRDRPRIRIVPADVPAHHSFSYHQFADAGPVVCVPCGPATLILEHDQVDFHTRQLALLDETALSEEDSKWLVMQLVNGGIDATADAIPEFPE